MDAAPLRVTVHIDGASRGNPGAAAAGVVVADAADGVVIHESGVFLGHATNNVAEYRGLLAGLEAAAALQAGEVELFSDSQLLVRQMTGEYRVRNAGLKPLHARARQLAGGFARCRFRHIPREENTRADALANQALNLRRNVADAEQ